MTLISFDQVQKCWCNNAITLILLKTYNNDIYGEANKESEMIALASHSLNVTLLGY